MRVLTIWSDFVTTYLFSDWDTNRVTDGIPTPKFVLVVSVGQHSNICSHCLPNGAPCKLSSLTSYVKCVKLSVLCVVPIVMSKLSSRILDFVPKQELCCSYLLHYTPEHLYFYHFTCFSRCWLLWGFKLCYQIRYENKKSLHFKAT